MRRFFVSIVLVLCALGVSVSAAQARSGQEVLFEAPNSVGTPNVLFPKLESLGVRAMRINLHWNDVAPQHDSRQRPSVDLTNPANYNWSRFQSTIDTASAKGWKVTLSLAGPVPRWATQGARDHITRPRASDYKNFAIAAARQYGKKITTWTIWNEPNFPIFLMPQKVHGKPASPAIYRALYVAGQSGLKKVLGSPRILIGETAPRAGASGVGPLAFLRGMLCLNSRYKKTKKCTRLSAAGYAHHPYPPASGPYFKPKQKDDVTIGVLSRLTGALDKAARAGAITRRLPVYLTEMGIQSYPDRAAGVPVATQSDFRSLAEKIAWDNPRVRGFSQYLLKDDPSVPGKTKSTYPGFQSGLEYESGKAKPAYDGFRLPLVAVRKGSRVTLWGLVRPARGRTKVTVQQAKKGSPWKTIKKLTTHSDTSWTLAAHDGTRRLWRVQWTDAQGQTHTGSATKAYARSR